VPFSAINGIIAVLMLISRAASTLGNTCVLQSSRLLQTVAARKIRMLLENADVISIAPGCERQQSCDD
jgi:hypothetical protein